MLGLRGGHAMKNVDAHHGIDLKHLNPANLARAAAAVEEPDEWTPPVLRSSGATGEGLPELLASLDRHFQYLERSGELAVRRRARLRDRVKDVVFQRLARRLWSDAATNEWIDDQIADLDDGRTTPYAVAEALLRRSGTLMTGEPA
jgi:LAO/AO transport system kinase